MRNKLKETSITSVPKSSTEQAELQEGENPSRDSSRGRKRSFDDDEPEKSDQDGEMDEAGHRRKRSRDSSYEEANATVSKSGEEQQQPEQNAGDLARKILSPKKKRSRDQLDKDETKTEDSALVPESKTGAAENGAPTEKSSVEGEPEKKRHRDASQEREKVNDSLLGGVRELETTYIFTYSVFVRPLSPVHSPIPPPSLPSGR